MPRTRVSTSTIIVGAAAVAVVGGAFAGAPRNIFNGGDLHESVGQADTKALRRGAAYQPRTFPIAVRLRPTDSKWAGVQLQSGRFRFVQLLHLRTGSFANAGRGVITLESAKGQTPSVKTTVQKLRSTPLIKAGPAQPVRLAGFSGETFDATITGSDPDNFGISLAPFTTNRHCGFCEETMHGEAQDYKFGFDGQLYRFIVISVRRKTVVIYVESANGTKDSRRHPPQQTFPTFLPFANRLLSTLRFP